MAIGPGNGTIYIAFGDIGNLAAMCKPVVMRNFMGLMTTVPGFVLPEYQCESATPVRRDGSPLRSGCG